MKKQLITLIIYAMLLSGCAVNNDEYVSKEEYENVVNQLTELESRLESVENNTKDNEDETINTEPEEISYEKKLMGEFSFDFDDNNSISLSVYKDGVGYYYVNGCGIYEEENSGLLYSDNLLITLLFYDALNARDIEVNYTIGEEEYVYSVLDGEVVSEVSLGEYSTPSKYRDNGKLKERQDLLDDFVNYIINIP